MTQASNPEIGQRVRTGTFFSNVHDQGSGPPVMLLHGSGAGVSAWANWRLLLPVLSKGRRVLAPDLFGFGYSDRPNDAGNNAHYRMEAWVQQAVDVLDALEISQADVVGNSFGGALALALAIAHPTRVRRLVLMGSVGVPFEITPGLEAAWGYTPSLDHMRQLLDIFAFDRSRVTNELAQLRYQASIQPGFQESFSAMFPAPRQRWIDAMASPEKDIRALPHHTLVVHGREDAVIPLATSLALAQQIPRSQLHVFGQCGHWTQIEHAARFAQLLENFFAEADAIATA